MEKEQTNGKNVVDYGDCLEKEFELPSTSHSSVQETENQVPHDEGLDMTSPINDLTQDLDLALAESTAAKQRLQVIDARIVEVLNENKFLRWENNRCEENNSSLRRSLEDYSLRNVELQAEIKLLKQNQIDINMVQETRRENIKQEAKKTIEDLEWRLRSELRLRQELEREVDMLKEKREREASTVRMLVEDNKKLYEKVQRLREELCFTPKLSPSSRHENESRPLRKLRTEYDLERNQRMAKTASQYDVDLEKLTLSNRKT